MKILKLIKIVSVGFFATFFLSACSSENAFSKAEDGLDDIEYDANRDYENEKKSYETQNDDYDDDYYERRSSSSYRPSSSSSNHYTNTNSISQYDYITTSMTLNLTLTHYEQIVCSMEGKGSKSCNYDDGDPRVTFEIIFYQTNGDSTTYSTRDKLGKNWFYYDDIGEWDGRKSFTVNVPAFTKTIKVCPYVEDDDAFGSHDTMSSGYCYLTYYIGQLDYRETNYQSDYENESCNLEWEWYLY